jgi:hypothetical protein
MRTLALNAARDICLGADGNLAILEGREAIAQNAATAMRALRGEMLFAADEGMPHFEAAFLKYRPALFEASARKTLAKVAGVAKVASLTHRREGDTLAYEAQLWTADGPAALKETLP